VSTAGFEPSASRAVAKYIAALYFALLACGCASFLIDGDGPIVPIGPPVRFLLTFDDGPSIWQPYNPTSAILDQLAANPVQSQIKALFFVQTRVHDGGGSEAGRTLLMRIHAEGHMLGLHNGSPRGHVSHRVLAPEELERSLADGTADIESITGAAPALVRPPFWSYGAATLAAYRRAGLHMLLTDINARDGVIYIWNISLRRRSHFRSSLAEVRENIMVNELPVVDGVIPVVVTFHDTNTFTARHMSEYLAIITEESKRVGLTVAEKPFYGSAAEIAKAALARSADAPASVAR
jgi:peptidoglycan/xylan/chitin deacetylase (PgdA/CDA1 family)